VSVCVAQPRLYKQTNVYTSRIHSADTYKIFVNISVTVVPFPHNIWPALQKRQNVIVAEFYSARDLQYCKVG